MCGTCQNKDCMPSGRKCLLAHIKEALPIYLINCFSLSGCIESIYNLSSPYSHPLLGEKETHNALNSSYYHVMAALVQHIRASHVLMPEGPILPNINGCNTNCLS